MELSYDSLLKQALQMIEKGQNLEEAQKMLNAMLNDCFDMNDHSYYLMFYLAAASHKLGNYGLAVILLRASLALKPDFTECICNIGFVYQQIGMRDKAQEVFESLMPIVNDSNSPLDNKTKSEYVTNLGSTYVANGTPNKAIKILDRALELDNSFECQGKAKWNRGLAYLEAGDYEHGFEDFDNGDRIKKDRNYLRESLPFWDGSSGTNLVVFGEQGIGDEIMFASMLPDLMKDCNVIFDAHIRLKDLFHNSFPGLHIYGTREGPDVPWAKFENIDAKIAIGSLGKFYRKKKEDFPGNPYLMADESLVAKYAKKLHELSEKPKIGISWMGGIVKTNKKSRKIEMEMLLPLLQMKEFDFISLQYNKGIGDKVSEFEKQHNVNLNHWQDMLDDYDETAGLVSNLDLIISVPQSVVHLAGALGVKCIQMCPKKALWQMGPYGENMPWYSCVENIWQEDNGDWVPVIEKAKEKLCSLLVKTTEN